MSRSTLIAIVGPLITILTLGSTFVYTQGGIAEKIETNEKGVEDNRKKIMSNGNRTQRLEVGQERIETKIDGVMSRFDRLETLIMDN